MIEIDPTIDYACKMLLGDPAHSRLTIHFLNAVLIPESPIVDVSYLNPIVPQEFEADKLSILDILAIDELGRRFNIEVQRTKPGWLPERLTYYAATQLVEQIGEGDSYNQLRPSIGICLLKAVLFAKRPGYHQAFRLRTTDGTELTDCLEIHVLELPKYAKVGDNHRVIDPLDQWMEFFCYAYGSSPKKMRQRLVSPVFEEAIGVLEMISKNPEQRRYYNARLKWELDENTRREAEEAARLASREAGWTEGNASGKAEGKAEGRAEGKVEGIAYGKAEQIRMLQGFLGQPLETLERLLEIPIVEMESIISDLQNQLRNRL